jgi:predicted AAA+ superfamily ATPase
MHVMTTETFTFTETTTALAIREYLIAKGEGYASEFYRLFKAVRPGTSYATVSKYFYYLRELRLIHRVRSERSPSRKSPALERQYHCIIEANRDNPAWISPQKALRDRKGKE